MKLFNLYDVMTNESTSKENESDEVMLNLRVKREIREHFRIAAKQKGSSMSGLLHQFVIKTIREEKEIDPSAFTKLPKKKNPAVKVSNETQSAGRSENNIDDELPSMTFEELQEWRREKSNKDKENREK